MGDGLSLNLGLGITRRSSVSSGTEVINLIPGTTTYPTPSVLTDTSGAVKIILTPNPLTADGGVFSWDDGTNNNRMVVRIDGPQARTEAIGRYAAASTIILNTIGGATATVPFTIDFYWDSALNEVGVRGYDVGDTPPAFTTTAYSIPYIDATMKIGEDLFSAQGGTYTSAICYESASVAGFV